MKIGLIDVDGRRMEQWEMPFSVSEEKARRT